MDYDQITEAQLMKLALDMVAAGSLTVIYGTEPFTNARAAFLSGLQKFIDQTKENARNEASGLYAEVEEEKPPSKFYTDASVEPVPECLKKFGGLM